MNKGNFIVFDIETSGRNPKAGHEIVKLTASAVNCWNLADHEAGTFDILLKPNNIEAASDKALQVIGNLWQSAQDEGIDPKVGLKEFLNWVDSVNDEQKWISRPILVGHNVVKFDVPFLVHWLQEYKLIDEPEEEGGDLNLPWHILQLDTWPLMFSLFESDPTMISYNLDSCLSKIGLERKTDKHDSTEDVRLNKELFVRYMKFLRECRKRVRTK